LVHEDENEKDDARAHTDDVAGHGDVAIRPTIFQKSSNLLNC